MEAWVSCEFCGSVGHSSSDCHFMLRPEVWKPKKTIDYDEAGRLVIKKLEQSNVSIKAVPEELGEGGRQLLARIGRIKQRPASASMFGEEVIPPSTATTTSGNEVQVCLRSKSCRCPQCDSGYVALAEVMQVPGRWALNCIWKPLEGDGEVYVGGLAAAKDDRLLAEYGITHVVNCMNRPSLNTMPGINYYDFSIEHCYEKHCRHLYQCTSETTEEVLAHTAIAVETFFVPALGFIKNACEAGGRVLIHCFAGAHRAGTTGVAWLMHMEHLRSDEALMTAQCLRPIIDPKAYGQLYTLLLLLEAVWFEEAKPDAIVRAHKQSMSWKDI